MGEGEEEEGLLPFPQFPPHFQPGSYLVKSYSEAATHRSSRRVLYFIYHISYICTIIIYALRCMVYGVYGFMVYSVQ